MEDIAKVTFFPDYLDGNLLVRRVGYAGEGEVLTSAYYDGDRFLLIRGDRALVLVEGEEAACKMLNAWAWRRFDKFDFYETKPDVLSDDQIRFAVEDVLCVRTMG